MGSRVSLVVRFGALLSVGALAVHQLRYLLAYGDQAGGALHATGHGYLVVAEPVLGVLLAFAVGQVVAAVARGGAASGPVRLRRRGLAAAFAFALLTVYVGQELVEGLLDPGHPDGLAGVVGQGGWIAGPLAALVGTLLALTVRAVEQARERVRLPGAVAAPRATVPGPLYLPAPTHAPRLAPLATRRAGRAPPRLLAA